MSERAERGAGRRRTLDLIAQVKRGQVVSYRDLSLKVYGHHRAAHASGNLIGTSFHRGGCLGWHRVVCADGTLSPSAGGAARIGYVGLR